MGGGKRYDFVGLRSWGNASRDQLRESGRRSARRHGGNDGESVAHLNEDVKYFAANGRK